jgi:hypothetical protein
MPKTITRRKIHEFVKNLQLITNGIGAENDKPSENPELAQDGY